MSTKNILVTITGPSVTGKSKLASLLKPYGFEELVSTTTRPPREGEVHGIHYNFVKQDAFDKLMEQNLMIEKVTIGSKSYGLSRPALDAVIRKGKNGVAVVEPNGAQQIGKFCKENNIELYQIFIDNAEKLLLTRLFERFKNDKLADPDVYSTRAQDMIHKEDKEWRQKAYSGEHYYDKLFDSFTLENEQDVVQSVVTAIESKLTGKKTSKMKVS